ncbi:MAG TPA: choline kinase family protein [Woeseiaceae bacterium]|nr:choline kinase family protein [Woeseiaceae bacterium]
MTGACRIEKVLQTIPGWEDASWRALSGGRTNRALLLSADGRKAVLKTDRLPRTAPFNSRAEEARIQATAHVQGLAAPVLFVSETLILTEYLAGEIWQPCNLASDAKLAQLASALRRLHRLPPSGRTFNALRAAEAYMRKLAGRPVDRELAEHHLAKVRQQGRPRNTSLCHNDLVAANIISSDGVRLLDWEYAADNEPLFDLAVVIVENQLTSAQADYLFTQYTDGDSASLRARLQQQVTMYSSLAWLWAAAHSQSHTKYVSPQN